MDRYGGSEIGLTNGHGTGKWSTSMGTRDSQMSQADNGLDDERASNSTEDTSETTTSQTPDSGGTVETDERAADSESAVEKPSLDLIFEVLKNSRRREAIQYLREQDERVSLGELAEHIAAIENDTTTKQLTSSQRKRVYVGLYQCHLPKMDDVGVVEFNQDRGHVALTEQVKFYEPYIDRTDDDRRRPWYQYYGAISITGLFAVVLSTVVLGSEAVILGVAVLIVFAIAACALVHRSVVHDGE